MGKTDGRRLDYLDYTRALGILLIVMQHAFQYFRVYDGIVVYIMTFHVTIFFVISGYLAGIKGEKNVKLKEAVFTRARRLLIPYVAFSSVNTFLKFIVAGIQGWLTKEVISQEMKEFFITGNGTVWFLTTLFCVEILFFLLEGKYKNVVYVITAFLPGILPFFTPQSDNMVLSVFRRTIAGYAFFVWGYFLGRYLLQRIQWKVLAGVILLAGGFAVWKSGDCNVSFMGGEFTGGVSVILVNICTVTGILLVMFLLDRKMKRKIRVLSYLGRNSLIIMVVHPILLMCYIYPFGGRIAGYSERMQWTAGMVLFLALMVLEIPAIELIQRYFPFLIGKKRKQQYG